MKYEKVYNCLKSLNGKKDVTHKLIMEKTGLTSSTVSIHINNLINCGYIEKRGDNSYKVFNEQRVFPYNKFRTISKRNPPIIFSIKNIMKNILRETDIGGSLSFYADCFKFDYQELYPDHRIEINKEIKRFRYKKIKDHSESYIVDFYDIDNSVMVHFVECNIEVVDYKLNSVLYSACLELDIEHLLIIHLTTHREDALRYEYFEVVPDPEV